MNARVFDASTKRQTPRRAPLIERAVRRSRWLLCLILPVVLFVGSAVIGPRAAAGDKTPDLATIRAAADYYAASIKTLEGKSVSKWSWGPNSPGDPPPNDMRYEFMFLADVPHRKMFLDERKSYYYFTTVRLTVSGFFGKLCELWSYCSS